LKSHVPKELLNALDEIENCLKEINLNIEKNLIPYEGIIIAAALLKPRFISNIYNFRDTLSFDLRLTEGSFTSGIPTFNKWFHLRIFPIWSSYEMDDKKIYIKLASAKVAVEWTRKNNVNEDKLVDYLVKIILKSGVGQKALPGLILYI
jgi:hypothetical protein